MNTEDNGENKLNALKSFAQEHPGVPLVDLSKVNDPASQMEMIANAMAMLEGPKSMRRDRPYNGQPWTEQGARGAQMISGITMRDLKDCLIRAVIFAHPSYKPGTDEPIQPNRRLYEEAEKGVDAQLNANDLADLVEGPPNIVVVAQCLGCEIEKLMGIFPNVPEKY